MATDSKIPLAQAILDIVVTGDLIGLGASGQHFVLIVIPASIFAQLAEYEAELEDLEPDHDNGDGQERGVAASSRKLCSLGSPPLAHGSLIAATWTD